MDESYEIVFEDREPRISYNTSNRTRKNKWFDIIISKKLDWQKRQLLIDIFPSIESFFTTYNRINFFQLEALARELLLYIDDNETAKKFKPMKSSRRNKAINIFLKHYFNKTSHISRTRSKERPFGPDFMCGDPPLTPIALSELKTDSEIYNSHKIPPIDHIFKG